MPQSNDTLFLVALVIAAVFGLTLGLIKILGDPPPCSDYSFKISRLPFNQKTAKCDKWVGMHMEIDRGLLGGTLVNCHCPAP